MASRRVGHQVHDHLLDLPGVDDDGGRLLGSSRTETRCPRRSAGRASTRGRATTTLRSTTRGCITCLRLNASSWWVRPAARSARLPDLLGVRPSGIGRVERLQQDVGVAADDGEQVVEVVRDAAGQPADGVDLLGLAQLLLGLAALVHLAAQRQVQPLRSALEAARCSACAASACSARRRRPMFTTSAAITAACRSMKNAAPQIAVRLVW